MTNDAASSPAVKSDAKGSSGLTSEQAAARLFAHAATAAQQRPPEQAAENTTPEPPAQSTEVPAAETTPVSAETTTTDPEAAPESTTTDDLTTTTENPEGVADDDLSPATLDEKLKGQIEKRIGKEVARRKAAETRLAELEAKLNQRIPPPAANATSTPTNPPTATTGNVPLAGPNHPLANVNDMGALVQHQQLAKDALRWAEDTLENPRAWKVKTDVDPQTGEETQTRVTMIGKESYDEAQIRAIRREAKITLEDHVPARREFLTQRAQAQKTTAEYYPFMKDKTSAEYQQAQSMLRDPWVQMRPDADWIVATQIMGIKAIEQQRAAANKPAATAAAKPKPAAKPSNDQSAVSSSGSPSRVTSDAQQRLAQQSDRKSLMAKGGITAADAATFLERNAKFRKSG